MRLVLFFPLISWGGRRTDAVASLATALSQEDFISDSDGGEELLRGRSGSVEGLWEVEMFQIFL